MKTEPKLRPVGFTPPSRCSSLSPPVALHFPPPSPSLPPAIALLILPSPSLPWLTLFPMLLLFSLSQSVCLPCSFSSPSPPQGPTHSSSSCCRWCTCAIGECGPAASPAPLSRCSSPSPACSPPTSPGLPSPTTRPPLPHCPAPPPCQFPLPSSSSCPSASSPSSTHSSASSTPLTHLGLSGVSVAPPSSLFPSHELASFTHLDPSH
ncbi:unnamed protein product [Closterium sp. NIES-64]|nr:unnamed protein product [Closterium sp. NIES-64]CAI5957050.1 unnamed protein product [Closterium sp. NIES-65]